MKLENTTYEIDGGIGTLTMNRPEALNSFNADMLREMLWVLEQADRDDDVRVLIVAGAGDRAFCAGADLSGGESGFVSDGDEGYQPAGVAEHRDGGGMLTLALHRFRKPVIAAIDGHAVGIGITMTLAMDIRVVADDAKIGFVFARRGIVPEACSSFFLPRIVGISKAAELCYTGRVFLAEAERDSGLFNYVLPRDQVMAKARELAGEIAENTSAVSIALSKALLWHGLGEEDPQSAHLIDSKCIYWATQNADATEGVMSFLEKRAPEFTMSAWTDMPDFYPWWKEPKV